MTIKLGGNEYTIPDEMTVGVYQKMNAAQRSYGDDPIEAMKRGVAAVLGIADPDTLDDCPMRELLAAAEAISKTTAAKSGESDPKRAAGTDSPTD